MRRVEPTSLNLGAALGLLKLLERGLFFRTNAEMPIQRKVKYPQRQWTLPSIYQTNLSASRVTEDLSDTKNTSKHRTNAEMPIQRKVKYPQRRWTLPSIYQTNLSASRVTEDLSDTRNTSKHQQISSKKDYEHTENIETDFQIAMRYFENETSRSRDKNLGKHLKSVENMAQKNGLSTEGIDILLNVALSGKFGAATNTRLLKCMIPATLIAEDSVVKAVSWLCVGKCPGSTKVLFYRWLVAMFDFIDHKEQINLLYGFFFASLQDDTLCPYVCHFLYLLTKKEHVKPFRVRKLLSLQAKMGMQPHLQALLSLYKFFAPTLISVSLPIRKKIYFKNSENLWKIALLQVRQRNQRPFPVTLNMILGSSNVCPGKKKRNFQSLIPEIHCGSSSNDYGQSGMSLSDYLGSKGSVKLEQLKSFPQLLENIHCLELPSQIGAVLKNPLLLHYINCITDESVLLRFYYWLSQTLQEECIWYKVNTYENEKEFTNFLDTIIKAQCFLQEGFYSCEAFLYKSLPIWDGHCFRSQVLQLVSWIPLSSFSELKPLIFDPLAWIFFTSTIYFKCSYLQSLKELLQNWLLRLSADYQMKLVNRFINPQETTLDGSMNSVAELIHYVGWLSTIAMRLESNRTFLLHFILDFYEKVCDIFINYDLPLLVVLPPGVFYPALLSMDASVLNQLGYIMHRYHNNLMSAKEKVLLKKTNLEHNFSSKTYQEFNQYLTVMVGCLWTSKLLENGTYIKPELFMIAGLLEYKNSLNLIHHPALLCYTVSFLLQEFPEERRVCTKLIRVNQFTFFMFRDSV